MVETVTQTTFYFSSENTPYSLASTMRTCYAIKKSSNSKTELNNYNSQNNLSTNKTTTDSRRGSLNELFLRNNENLGSTKRCSNIITTTSINSDTSNNNPKLQLTTSTTENSKNNLISSCTTKLSATRQHQSNSFQNQQFLNSSTNRYSSRQKRSDSLGLGAFRPASEIINDKNNNLTNSFEDNQENSNSSEDELIFVELSSSPSNNQETNFKTPNKTNSLSLCKRCSSNSSLCSFSSSVSSSLSSTNNSQTTAFLNPQDSSITNLSNSLNQTFYSTNNCNNLSTPQFGRSRHNSINSLTSTNQPTNISSSYSLPFQTNLQPGDLVEIDRTLYAHWGLYIGNGEIIHFVDPKTNQDLPIGEYCLIKKDALVSVAGNSFVRVNNKEVPAKERGLTAIDSSEVIKNALSMVGKTVLYNILTKNCEHYLTELKYGQGWSDQAKIAMSSIKVLRKNSSSGHTFFVNTLNSVLNSPGAYTPSSPSFLRSYSLSSSSNNNSTEQIS